MVEFALVRFVAMIVLFVAIQMAFIGQTALALGQPNYQATRYAAVNPTYDCDQVKSYMQANGAPTLVKTVTEISGRGGCSLPPTMTVGSGPSMGVFCSVANTTTQDSCASRSLGGSVQVSLAFDMTSRIFLFRNTTNPNFLGIPFPTMLTSMETAMSK